MDNGINRISVWGDSILKGAVTGKDSGHLFDIIEENSLSIASEKLGFELDNQSVFGSTVIKTQRRLNRSLEKEIQCDLGIIESGGNDCDYDWTAVSEKPDEEHSPRVPLDEFIRIISEMVSALRKKHITPLVMTMPPLVPDFWFEHICRGHDRNNILKFLGGAPDRLYRNHELYNLTLMRYCFEHDVQFVDMRLAMLEADDYRNLMCRDGIHPNEDGYRYMAGIWEKRLPEIKREF